MTAASGSLVLMGGAKLFGNNRSTLKNKFIQRTQKSGYYL